jgi:hypothetical protein
MQIGGDTVAQPHQSLKQDSIMSYTADPENELFHYTGVVGLEGILRSQCLWASNPYFLNDDEEIVLFHARLKHALEPLMRDILAEVKGDPHATERVCRRAGSDVQTATHNLCNGLFYRILGNRYQSPVIDPYVVSFSVPSGSSGVAEHGLLSQWRGYGHEGGYAIVFDRRELQSLVSAEARHLGLELFLGEVVYSDRLDDFTRGFDTSLQEIRQAVRTFLTTDEVHLLPDLQHLIAISACRFKHWGFHEEKEVRLIVTLLSQDEQNRQRLYGPVREAMPRHQFFRNGTPVPTVHVFERGVGERRIALPIKRIVVGPHREKVKRRDALRIMLGGMGLDRVQVSISDIPFVDHG